MFNYEKLIFLFLKFLIFSVSQTDDELRKEKEIVRLDEIVREFGFRVAADSIPDEILNTYSKLSDEEIRVMLAKFQYQFDKHKSFNATALEYIEKAKNAKSPEEVDSPRKVYKKLERENFNK